MVIKVYVSGISGNKEVKKRQQRVIMILDSKNVKYEVIDIAEPGAEEEKDFMQNNSTSVGATIGDPNPRHPLPPQIFNDDVYCGDYDMFDLANEVDEMEKFLKLEPSEAPQEQPMKNGDISKKENEVPNQQDEKSPFDDEKPDTNGDQHIDQPDAQKNIQEGNQKEASPEKADE